MAIIHKNTSKTIWVNPTAVKEVIGKEVMSSERTERQKRDREPESPKENEQVFQRSKITAWKTQLKEELKTIINREELKQARDQLPEQKQQIREKHEEWKRAKEEMGKRVGELESQLEWREKREETNKKLEETKINIEKETKEKGDEKKLIGENFNARLGDKGTRIIDKEKGEKIESKDKANNNEGKILWKIIEEMGWEILNGNKEGTKKENGQKTDYNLNTDTGNECNNP
ncbi:hypothetical protein Zmor_006288 [Zophobas morio]|uniref:Uncharacterized protein n=1 Tax=Zophobas morio TaxID=2755281 RepID=A0AA38MN88_9CUCU|nr:hypothetical protein Zmor_006288 [Zophobas morio]